jgi:hypothetical protein
MRLVDPSDHVPEIGTAYSSTNSQIMLGGDLAQR